MDGKRKIDIETWDRREHFEFFRRSDLPFYNITCRVDIGKLPGYVKRTINESR